MADKMRKILLKSWLPIVICTFSLFVASESFAFEEEVKFVGALRSGLELPVDMAVNSQGDVYVLDKKLAQVLVYSSDGKVKMRVGERGSQLGQLFKPESIALSQKGEIIVADTGNHRLQVYKPNGQFGYEIGNEGRRSGEFEKPASVTVDLSGNIFVADSSLKRVSKFSPNGVFLKDWGLPSRPTDMVFDRNNDLYALFAEAGKIYMIDGDSHKIKKLSVHKEVKKRLKDAHSLAVDFRGDVYVVESASHKVMKIDKDEKLLFSFGSNGMGKGQFNQPQGIASDDRGHIFVADSKNKRVQKLLISGSEKETLAKAPYEPPVVDYDDSIYVGKSVADIKYKPQHGLYALKEDVGQIVFKGNEGKTLKKQEELAFKLKHPKALYVENDGSILVSDTGNHRLQFLNSDGTYQYHFGRKGEDTSEFRYLEGVAVDNRGYIYVADTHNHRIQIFNNDGIYLKAFGSKSDLASETGPAPGTFIQPTDLAFNSHSLLHVLDYKNRRIQVFDQEGGFIKQFGGPKGEITFMDPVDLAIDEHDYLYVADRGQHAVKIIDDRGKFVTQFGSSGKGPSYFPRLTSVDSVDGKIYVADYFVDKVQVFRYNIEEKDENTRFMLTRRSKPLKMENSSNRIREAMSKKLLMSDLKEEFTEKIGISENDFMSHLKIEEEIVLDDGQVQLTVSIPKDIIPVKYTALSMR